MSTSKCTWWPVGYEDKKPEDLPPAFLKAIEAISRGLENAEANRLRRDGKTAGGQKERSG